MTGIVNISLRKIIAKLWFYVFIFLLFMGIVAQFIGLSKSQLGLYCQFWILLLVWLWDKKNLSNEHITVSAGINLV